MDNVKLKHLMENRDPMWDLDLDLGKYTRPQDRKKNDWTIEFRPANTGSTGWYVVYKKTAFLERYPSLNDAKRALMKKRK